MIPSKHPIKLLKTPKLTYNSKVAIYVILFFNLDFNFFLICIFNFSYCYMLFYIYFFFSFLSQCCCKRFLLKTVNIQFQGCVDFQGRFPFYLNFVFNSILFSFLLIIGIVFEVVPILFHWV